jgi:hypothetical protein
MGRLDTPPSAVGRLAVGAVGVQADDGAILAAVARATRRLLEDVQDARALPPPAPEEALRLKAEWERLIQWSADVIGEHGTDGGPPVADLLRRCRAELTAFLEEVNRDAARRDEAPV